MRVLKRIANGNHNSIFTIKSNADIIIEEIRQGLRGL